MPAIFRLASRQFSAACLALAACDSRTPSAVRDAAQTVERPADRPIRYFLASLVRFEGASPCPFKVNAVQPWCVALAQSPFAGPGHGKRRFGLVRPTENCSADITGIRCDEPHLFFDPQTLDTIWGARRFAAGGAFLIDRIASGKGDWMYRLYEGDGFNMTVTCYYPARDNELSAMSGQLTDAEARRLCEIDRLRYDDL